MTMRTVYCIGHPGHPSWRSLYITPGKALVAWATTSLSHLQLHRTVLMACCALLLPAAAVVDCQPEVPGWQALAEEMLGQQQDLTRFMAAMRRRFKEVAAATDGVAALSLQQRQQRRRS